MANISKIKVGTTEYNVKDSVLNSIGLDIKAIADVSENASTEDLAKKMNEILSKFRSLTCLAVCCGLSLFGALGANAADQVQPLRSLHKYIGGQVEMVTNQVEWINSITNNLPKGGGITTNDVCNIVTNRVSSEWVKTSETTGGHTYSISQIKWNGSSWKYEESEDGSPIGWMGFEEPAASDPNALHLVSSSHSGVTATRESPKSGNALGLAYAEDVAGIASNYVRSATVANNTLYLTNYVNGVQTNFTFKGGSGSSITDGTNTIHASGEWVTVTNSVSGLSETNHIATKEYVQGVTNTLYASLAAIEDLPATASMREIVNKINEILAKFRPQQEGLAPLKFTATQAPTEVSMAAEDEDAPTLTLLSSVDGGSTWQNFVVDSSLIELSNVGDSVLIKAGSGGNATISIEEHRNFFTLNTGRVAASGNVNSLLNATEDTDTLPDYCYSGLFKECSALETAPELPSKTVGAASYSSMFYECSNLANAPTLPATTLADSCYAEMFSDCTSLRTAPALPVTALQSQCYAGMFSGCSSLESIPELPATELAEGCYATMFAHCSSLKTAPTLPATTLADSCYGEMFSETGLTNTPVLSVMNLEPACYAGMFSYCTELKTAPALPATTLAEHCYAYMFDGCSSLTNAPVLNASAPAVGCYMAMFYDCTSLEKAPALPATTVAESCYSEMFAGCTSLTTAPTLNAPTLDETDCYAAMFTNCTSLTSITTYQESFDNCAGWLPENAGTFKCKSTLTIPTTRSVDNVPSTWTIDPSL